MIPPQPHGRHLRQIREIVARSPAPDAVKGRADAAFTLIAEQEAAIHGTTVDRVHLHEVGAVDAILDVVGAVWGFERLGVQRIHCGAIAVGDGVVKAAHGTLPVPAPATLRLLEGLAIRPGPEGSGELVTPTGAALVQVLASGAPPAEYVPRRSGFGAGTKEFAGRANALRIVLADTAHGTAGDALEDLVVLSADIDDMSPEYVATLAELARDAGALDVVLLPTVMKKGRSGTRVDILVRPADVDRMEELLFLESSTIGVRRQRVVRRALARRESDVDVLGERVRVKIATMPGGRTRAKPDAGDVRRVALATGRNLRDIFRLAADAAERSE